MSVGTSSLSTLCNQGKVIMTMESEITQNVLLSRHKYKQLRSSALTYFIADEFARISFKYNDVIRK